MARRSIRLIAALGLALALASVAGAAAPPSRSADGDLATVVRTQVAASGRYAVAVGLTSSARRDTVVLRVGALPLRRVTVTAHRLTRLTLDLMLSRTITLRAVGHAERPRLTVSTRLLATPRRALGLPAPGAPAVPSATAAPMSGGSGSTSGGEETGSSDTSSPPTAGASSGGASAGGDAPPYTTLVWSSDFTGAAGAQPDPSQWTFDLGAYGGGDGELETYTDSPANASLDGQGDLAITALHQTATGPDGVTRPYTSARLETAGLFSFTYGRVEARMRVPAGAGLWPAFWMLGDDIDTVGWPASGEIDVMEMLGQDPMTVYGTIHGPITGSTADYQVQGEAVSPQSLADDFHTYGVIWQPGRITWTLDGVAYATVTPEDLAPGEEWVFDGEPFHLVLNLAVGGDWPGAPTASTSFPASLLVQWVRVYR